MSISIMVVYVILFLIWIYAFVSVISDEFENKNEKVFWIIGVVFVPILSLFYIIKKKF